MQMAVVYDDGDAPLLEEPGAFDDEILRIPPREKAELLGKDITQHPRASVHQMWFHVKYKDKAGWIGSWLAGLQVESTADVPAYELRNHTTLAADDRVYGDVIIEGLAKVEDEQARLEVVKAIVNRHDLQMAQFYTTRDAHQANVSESFAKKHPDALKKGLLGTWENGEFSLASGAPKG